MKRSIHIFLMLVAGVAFALGASPVAAEAAQFSASGSQSCPAGQHVYVRVDLIASGDVTFSGGSRPFVSKSATYHIQHYHGQRVVSWSVRSTSGIATVGDGCTPDPVR